MYQARLICGHWYVCSSTTSVPLTSWSAGNAPFTQAECEDAASRLNTDTIMDELADQDAWNYAADDGSYGTAKWT